MEIIYSQQMYRAIHCQLNRIALIKNNKHTRGEGAGGIVVFLQLTITLTIFPHFQQLYICRSKKLKILNKEAVCSRISTFLSSFFCYTCRKGYRLSKIFFLRRLCQINELKMSPLDILNKNFTYYIYNYDFIS